MTIVEFSDFQCPSCQRAAGYVDPILAKHGDKVRYIRFDLPLSGHAWAFPAALAGRAIHRQKPELFWEYKKQVYANQEQPQRLHVLGLGARLRRGPRARSRRVRRRPRTPRSIKTEILNGAGTAFSNDIRATPSYMVNGAIVDAGEDGKDLAAYVEKLVAK